MTLTPATTFFSAIWRLISGAQESTRVSLISADESFPASSETLIRSFPGSLSLSPEEIALFPPLSLINPTSTLQDFETSSIQVAATVWSRRSWSVLISTETPAMTFFSCILRLISGALVSLVGLGGVGPGEGTSGSVPPQARRRDRERNQESILAGIEKNLRITYRSVIVIGTSSLKPFHWSSTVMIWPWMDWPGV